ncbi:MAG TPA: nucleotidyltransferase family protein [Gemmata sp.]|nr:nucleotidyltransferase family protein [Gemmata sp.]
MFRTDLSCVTAAILAGGLGTRLRSLVADRPKVLAPVAGRPFLAHLLDQLVDAGVRETVLLVGHMARLVREEFAESYRGMRLAYSTEPSPLGTGGAIRLALPLFQRETILLLNGDSYCSLDFAAFLHVHRHAGAAASLALAHVPNASRFGRVVLGKPGRVERFEEKSAEACSGWINAGVYLLDRGLIAGVEPGRSISLERELMPAWVAAGRVFGFQTSGRFIDIGIPESYREAEAFFDRQGVRRTDSPVVSQH